MDAILPSSMFGIFGLLAFVALDELIKELPTSTISKFG